MRTDTVWSNTPADEFDWEAEAWYTVQSPENISNNPRYVQFERAQCDEWYILPIPEEVRAELRLSKHTRKESAIRSAQWYAEKHPNAPIRVVRHSFEESA